MKRKLLTFAVVAMLPLMMNAQTAQSRIQIDLVDTETKCMSAMGPFDYVPVQVVIDFTSMPTNAEFKIEKPDGTFLPSLTAGIPNGQIPPVTLGSVNKANARSLNGEYKVWCDFGVPGQQTLVDIHMISISGGPIGIISLPFTGTNNPDGSATIEATCSAIDYDYSMSYMDTLGAVLSTDNPCTMFLPIGSALLTDGGGCTQAYSCITAPTGVPMTPTTNLVGVNNVSLKNLFKGVPVSVTNPASNVTYRVEYKSPRGINWIPAGTLTSNTKLYFIGKYQVKAKNTIGKESVSATFELKCNSILRTAAFTSSIPQDAKVVEYAVIDMNGKVVGTGVKMPIDLTGLARGYYVERIIYDNHNEETITVFVESNNFVQMIR